MEYTVLQLAELAGVSTRTLRYYDQVGLLTPVRDEQSGYRIYGEREVDILFQILFYKELGFGLAQIGLIIKDPNFDMGKALKCHLKSLEAKETKLRLLIETVKKTILKEEGKITMTDTEKFAGLKKSIIDQNEKLYGDEIRKSYGDSVVGKSYEKMMNLTEGQYHQMKDIESRILETLKKAVEEKADPSGEVGQQIVNMHREWLCYTWAFYSAEAHRGLGEMYVADERFRNYYDKEIAGCAAFLNNALKHHIR